MAKEEILYQKTLQLNFYRPFIHLVLTYLPELNISCKLSVVRTVFLYLFLKYMTVRYLVHWLNKYLMMLVLKIVMEVQPLKMYLRTMF